MSFRTRVASTFAVFSGALSSDLLDCARLAREVLGDRADDPDSGALASAYLSLRFGRLQDYPDVELQKTPPFFLGVWRLTTPDEDVCLYVAPSVGSPLALSIGYSLSRGLAQEIEHPPEAWRRRVAELVVEHYPGAPQAHAHLDAQHQADLLHWLWHPGNDAAREAIFKLAGDCPRLDNRKWREGPAYQRRVGEATEAALEDLLRPVDGGAVSVDVLGRLPRPTSMPTVTAADFPSALILKQFHDSQHIDPVYVRYVPRNRSLDLWRLVCGCLSDAWKDAEDMVREVKSWNTSPPALLITPPIISDRGLSFFVRLGNLAVRCSFDSAIADHPSVVPPHVTGLIRGATRAMLEDRRLYTEVEDAQP